MDPRPVLRGSRRLVAFAPLAVTATLSCAPPSDPVEGSPADEPAPSPTGATGATGVERAATTSTSSSFALFESGQVRPLALSQNKQHLFAVNTPDNRLEVFRVHDDGLGHVASIPVGLEPVAVAVRNDHEVWVVNHLSDSVSVVELGDDASSGHVARPLPVVPRFTPPPRPLAAPPDGTRVYAAGFHTGNQTTTIGEPSIPDGFGPD